MAQKTRIVEQLGDSGLLLPGLVAAGLRANDRAKYYMSLIQACRDHSIRPNQPPIDLRPERESSGEDDAALDEAISGSRTGPDGTLLVPHAHRIHSQLLGSIDAMVAPLRLGADANVRVDVYDR